MYILLKLLVATADLSLAEINSFNNACDANLYSTRSLAPKSTSQHLQFQFMLDHYARFILCYSLTTSRRKLIWHANLWNMKWIVNHIAGTNKTLVMLSVRKLNATWQEFVWMNFQSAIGNVGTFGSKHLVNKLNL